MYGAALFPGCQSVGRKGIAVLVSPQAGLSAVVNTMRFSFQDASLPAGKGIRSHESSCAPDVGESLLPFLPPFVSSGLGAVLTERSVV